MDSSTIGSTGSTGSSVSAGCPTVDDVGLDVVRASRVLFPVVGLDVDSSCPPKSKKSSPRQDSTPMKGHIFSRDVFVPMNYGIPCSAGGGGEGDGSAVSREISELLSRSLFLSRQKTSAVERGARSAPLCTTPDCFWTAGASPHLLLSSLYTSAAFRQQNPYLLKR